MSESEPDPSMYGSLPPGAWWEVANGRKRIYEPSADLASDAAILVRPLCCAVLPSACL